MVRGLKFVPPDSTPTEYDTCRAKSAAILITLGRVNPPFFTSRANNQESQYMSRTKWKCLDCNVDTGQIGEHYFINTSTWLNVVGSNKGMLCIGCLEIRLGRKLNIYDFPTVYINSLRNGSKSLRLINRLTSRG